MRTLKLLGLSLVAIGLVPAVACAAASAAAAHPPETPAADCCKAGWGYHEPIEPARWSALSPCYAPCAGGDQSPIDIVNPRATSLPPLETSYGTIPALRVRNDGHTIQADVPAEAPADRVTLRIAGVDYRLVQFHFHTPSEHTVMGAEAPIEMHLVHAGPGGRAAVIGVFIREGEPNPELSKIWARLPVKPGDEATVVDFDLRGLLPRSLDSYRYAGSLTTPACGQGVAWNVLAESISLSARQIGELHAIFSGKLFPDGNRRPVQPLNGRVVLTDVQPE